MQLNLHLCTVSIIQQKLPKGTVVAPVILMSDKTNLSQFCGNKQAWPVYLTIGNILKGIWRQPSSHGSILIGYLPVTKLTCFSEGARANTIPALPSSHEDASLATCHRMSEWHLNDLCRWEDSSHLSNYCSVHC